ncbi:MAG: thiamine-binding protein [Defluviitaleaceae bacterium]|nr:thiamine-binding protein [Defluviitaleaceae bacterium]
MSNHKCSIAIQILPMGDGEISVGIVTKIIEYIQACGLTYEVGPFETTIEGELEELMEIVKTCQTLAIKEGASNVMSYVKIFYNPGGVLTIEEKTKKFRTTP